MIGKVVSFVKLPFALIVIWSVGRLLLGMFGVPYSPRGTSIFSIVVLSYISSVYFGALSGKVGGFGWLGTVLVGVAIGVFSQIFVFVFSVISLAGGWEWSYFIHWDALNLPPETTIADLTMGSLIGTRLGGIFANSIICGIIASIGRAMAGLAPTPATQA